MALYRYTTPDARCLHGTARNAVMSQSFQDSNKSTVTLAEGVNIDIAKCPHLLIAGTTGSGKSNVLHCIIASLLLKNGPQQAEFLIIDPKMVEFEYFYRNQPCLYCPIVTDPEEALLRLEQASAEMMRRYGVNKAEGRRFWNGSRLYIVIDEIADLVSAGGKRLERVIEKIARLGRGAGVHLICATQHPTSDVLSRQITTNLDVRICLRVRDSAASRLVLGHNGAEQLRGRGDAILQGTDGEMRFQAAYICDDDLERFSHSWTLTPLEQITDSNTQYYNSQC